MGREASRHYVYCTECWFHLLHTQTWFLSNWGMWTGLLMPLLITHHFPAILGPHHSVFNFLAIPGPHLCLWPIIEWCKFLLARKFGLFVLFWKQCPEESSFWFVHFSCKGPTRGSHCVCESTGLVPTNHSCRHDGNWGTGGGCGKLYLKMGPDLVKNWIWRRLKERVCPGWPPMFHLKQQDGWMVLPFTEIRGWTELAVCTSESCLTRWPWASFQNNSIIISGIVCL